MNVIDAINSRRSIRKYKSEMVDDALVDQILDAARLAPSGNNAQPSRYIVIQNTGILKERNIIRDKWAYDAPVIIVCCADPSSYHSHIKDWDDSNETRALRDLSIASSYLVLRAQELGLGTCYIGWLKKEEIKNVLNIPQRFVVPYVITLGYPDESPSPRPRKAFNDIVKKM